MYSWEEHTAALNNHRGHVEQAFMTLTDQMNKLGSSFAQGFARQQVLKMAVLFQVPDDIQRHIDTRATPQSQTPYEPDKVTAAFQDLEVRATTDEQYCFPIPAGLQRDMFMHASQKAKVYLKLAKA